MKLSHNLLFLQSVLYNLEKTKTKKNHGNVLLFFLNSLHEGEMSGSLKMQLDFT